MRKNNSNRILFFSRDPGGVQSILPVICNLSGQGEFQPLVLSNTTSRYLYERNGIASVPVVEDEDHHTLPEFFRASINSFRPDLIVTGTSIASPKEGATPEQVLIALAKRNGIPCLCILDFWGRYMDRFSADGKTVTEEYLPDRICVMDIRCRDELISLGLDRERIAVTQNPYFDDIVRWANEVYPEPADEIRPGKINILYVSQPLREFNWHKKLGYTQHSLFYLIVEELLQWDSSIPKHIIVWVHPKEDPKRWEKCLGNSSTPLSFEIAQKRPCGGDIFSHVTFLATSHSSVVYEALYYGTPCLSIQPGGKGGRDQLITNKLELSIPVYSREELQVILLYMDFLLGREILKRKKLEMCAGRLFFSDGKATQRVLDIIRNMVSQ